MKRLLLLIYHHQNRHLLAQSLKDKYRILSPTIDGDFVIEGEELLHQSFDLCFVDLGTIRQLRKQLLARRQLEIPAFLPFILLTTLQDIGFSTDHLESLIDDIIYTPIQKIELQTKLRVLLRSRSYSLQLQATQTELNLALVKEKELNKLKSRFLSIVSHEFRNPLNGIYGMTQILQTYGDKLDPEKKENVLAGLQRNVKKMTELLDDVLIITQKDLGKVAFNPQQLQLETFCRGLIGEIQIIFNNKQKINFIYQSEQETFNLDSKLLDHILSNLLSNACKYSPQNSIIDFEISNTNAEITFIIRDRGIGIPPQDLPNLFNSFYRASNSEGFPGTGLGLAIVKEYVELHQGTISVESELNVGTIFKLTIPILMLCA
ncbi:histidine kinase [Chondrocystis sp. NIES-4102]|nr:histidine kinase [Chondrocystis sp. NIES-4102]